MNVTSSAATTAIASADVQDQATILVASRALDQTRADGQAALALIAGASAPSTGDHRGQLVNVLA
jgi:hypothetical protein